MAEKELRKMNRTELIEIIYALQQNERSLREENEKLQKQLDNKLLRMEQAGSIAEAALSLNHIFEDAENAAQQYLLSLKDESTGAALAMAEAQRKADAVMAEAQQKAAEILNDAQEKAAGTLAEAQQKADAVMANAQQEANAVLSKAEKQSRQTEEECRAMLDRADQELQRKRAAFARNIRSILKQYPELAARMREEAGKNVVSDTS